MVEFFLAFSLRKISCQDIPFMRHCHTWAEQLNTLDKITKRYSTHSCSANTIRHCKLHIHFHTTDQTFSVFQVNDNPQQCLGTICCTLTWRNLSFQLYNPISIFKIACPASHWQLWLVTPNIPNKLSLLLYFPSSIIAVNAISWLDPSQSSPHRNLGLSQLSVTLIRD